jgi:hypothetical protein
MSNRHDVMDHLLDNHANMWSVISGAGAPTGALEGEFDKAQDHLNRGFDSLMQQDHRTATAHVQKHADTMTRLAALVSSSHVHDQGDKASANTLAERAQTLAASYIRTR